MSQQQAPHSIQLCKSTRAYDTAREIVTNIVLHTYILARCKKLFALKMHNNAELQLLMIVLM